MSSTTRRTSVPRARTTSSSILAGTMCRVAPDGRKLRVETLAGNGGQEMRRLIRSVVAVLPGLILLPTLAFAQVAAPSLAGNVKDTSGAVLPGVSVEAASDVLIERSRTAFTDGSGLYRIENLLPGVYTVTFTLTGFATVRREAV